LKIDTLDKYWRWAIQHKYQGRCAVCFKPAVDAHHVVKRSQNWFLRWDIENGVALCRECHSQAESLYYLSIILKIVDGRYLEEMEKKYRFKTDVLKDLKMSEAEFKKQKAEELRSYVKKDL
jgi:hypothetical protein